MKLFTQILLIAGIVLFGALAAYYFVTPAHSLLHFFPGYDGTGTQPHVKHALAAAALAVGCGVVLWFSTGKEGSSATPPSEPAE